MTEKKEEKERLQAPARPCASCPYRKDIPSGIWEQHEYDKLPEYDGPTWAQSPKLFLCHQRDGNICGGWLACHDPQELLALRFSAGDIDPKVFFYETDIPVFASGAEARAHGIRAIKRPGAKARRLIHAVARKLQIKSEETK